MTKSRYHHGNLANALLDAAQQQLIECGTEKFSLRAVAKRAGVSHAAPAHHFGDLQGLLTALAARGYQQLLQQQDRYLDKAQSDPHSRLVALGLGYINFAGENPALFRLMFSSDHPNREDEHFAQISLEAFNNLVAETRALLKRDPYKDANAMQDLVTSWALVHGLAELIVSGRTERPLGLSSLSDEDKERVLTNILLRIKHE